MIFKELKSQKPRYKAHGLYNLRVHHISFNRPRINVAFFYSNWILLSPSLKIEISTRTIKLLHILAQAPFNNQEL